ncbi:hypothetical protein M8006_15155 [Halomonas sp. ATCHA]|uniref:Uncharacterized protein n=1 Tax=Halomonas llamarensis TaxID=2945104 RepID=A0ABT0STY4_9GAMM|nr:hypothetical protein [Halomonas llamarensis]
MVLDHVTGAHAKRGGETAVDTIDGGDFKALADDRQPHMAGEGTATGAEFNIGHENGLSEGC